MKSKLVSIVVLVAMLAGLLGACAPAAPAASTGPVKIVYWRSITGAAGTAQDDLGTRFNASQQAISVDVQYQGTYPELQTKLIAAIAAKSTPDIVLLDSPMMPYFAKNGQLVALDDYIKGKDGVDLNDFYAGLYADGKYDGKQYAWPFARSTPVLYYNKDMFKEAGLPDRAPETWTEFREFCRKLTVKDKRVGYAVQLGLTTAHWYFQGMLYGFGNDVSDDKYNIFLDQPTALTAAKYLQDLIKDGIAVAGPDAQGEFTNQRSGMHFGSTGSLTSIASTSKFNVGVGFIPGEVRRQVPIGGSVIAVMATSSKEKQDAAWKFIKFMTQADSNVYFVQQSGYMPISKKAAESPEMVAFMTKNPNFKVAVNQLQFVRPQASVMAFPQGTEIFRQLVEKLTVGKVDPATALKAAKDDLIKNYNESFK